MTLRKPLSFTARRIATAASEMTQEQQTVLLELVEGTLAGPEGFNRRQAEARRASREKNRQVKGGA